MYGGLSECELVSNSLREKIELTKPHSTTSDGFHRQAQQPPLYLQKYKHLQDDGMELHGGTPTTH